jgi:hypothetical protein
MPCHRAQLSEVHFAEGDKENEEHEQRQNGRHDGGEEHGGLVELRHEAKKKVNQSAQSHCDRERPVFDKAYYIHISVIL